MGDDVNKFKQVLLHSPHPFPFVDPPNYWKAPIIVGAQQQINLFEKMIINSKSQGYYISYVVGAPGAGKTHFLCHLNYLHYEKKTYNGLYYIYSASETRITPKVLLQKFFKSYDVLNRIKYMITEEDLLSYRFPQIGMKELLEQYMNDPRIVSEMDYDRLTSLAIAVSICLFHKNSYMCIVIDNVDEYFRWLSTLENKPQDAEDETFGINISGNNVTAFFSMLRNTATNLRNFLLLLACTDPVYDHLDRILVDRTHAGRINKSSEILGPLTESEAIELVYKYMNYWAESNKITLPESDECMVDQISGESLNIFPFTGISIEEIYNVTGQYARDIKMICSEAIDDMINTGDVWVVKNELLLQAIENSSKKRPQIIPRENFELFKNKRIEWLGSLLENKLCSYINNTRLKYAVLNTNVIYSALDSYIQYLGINITKNIDSIKNIYNSNDMTNNSNIRIIKVWDNDVLLSYLISSKKPIIDFSNKATLRNYTDAISYIYDDEYTKIQDPLASHVLFITLWYGPLNSSTHSTFRYKYSPYIDVMKEFKIDDNIWNILASLEGSTTEQERRDLVEYVDKKYVKLRDNLKNLIRESKKEGRSHKDYIKEMRKRAKEF